MPFEITPLLVAVTACVLIGGFVRGFAGFGGPLIMLPTMTELFVPAIAVAMVMWIDIFSNIRLVPDARQHAMREVVVPLIGGSLVTLPIGVLALVLFDPGVMKKVISLAILLAAMLLLSGWRSRRRLGALAWAGVGALSGGILGMTAIAVTTALFLNSGHQTQAQARANFIIWGVVTGVLMLAVIAYSRPLPMAAWKTIAAFVPLYFIGTALGAKLHHTVDPSKARKVILLFVAAIAVVGLLR